MAVTSSYRSLQVVYHVLAEATGQTAAFAFWNAAGKNLAEAIGKVFHRERSLPAIGQEYFKGVHCIDALRVLVLEGMRHMKPSDPVEGFSRRVYSNVIVLCRAANYLSNLSIFSSVAKTAEVLLMTVEGIRCWKHWNGFQFRGKEIQESTPAKLCKALKVSLFFLTNSIIFLSWLGYRLSPQAKKIYTYSVAAYSIVNFVNQFFTVDMRLRLLKPSIVPPIPLEHLTRHPPSSSDDSSSPPPGAPAVPGGIPTPPPSPIPEPALSTGGFSFVDADFLVGDQETDEFYAAASHFIASIYRLIGRREGQRPTTVSPAGPASDTTQAAFRPGP